MSNPDVEIVRRLFQTVEERDLETMFELYDPEAIVRFLERGGVGSEPQQ